MGEMNSVRMQKEDQNGGWWRYRYLIAGNIIYCILHTIPSTVSKPRR